MVFLEVLDSIFSSFLDALGILDAFLDIVETFGISSTLEEALNNLHVLQSRLLIVLLGGSDSQEEPSQNRVFHFDLVFVFLID